MKSARTIIHFYYLEYIQHIKVCPRRHKGDPIFCSWWPVALILLANWNSGQFWGGEMAVSVLFKIFSRKFELTLAFSQLLAVIQNYGSDPGAVFKLKPFFKKKKKIHWSFQIFEFLNKNLNSKDIRRICFSYSFCLFLSLLHSITVTWSLREKEIKSSTSVRALWKEVFHFGMRRREQHGSIFAHWTAWNK